MGWFNWVIIIWTGASLLAGIISELCTGSDERFKDDDRARYRS